MGICKCGGNVNVRCAVWVRFSKLSARKSGQLLQYMTEPVFANLASSQIIIVIIYGDVYTCSLEIRAQTRENCDRIVKERRHTDMHFRLCLQLSSELLNNTLHNLELGLFGKRPVDRGGDGGVSSTKGQIFQKSQTLIFFLLSFYFSSSSIRLAEQNGGLQKWKPLSQSPEPQR